MKPQLCVDFKMRALIFMPSRPPGFLCFRIRLASPKTGAGRGLIFRSNSFDTFYAAVAVPLFITF